MDLSDAIDLIRPSVVQIRDDGGIRGTGFLVHEDGLVVTALHVVQGIQGGDPWAGFVGEHTEAARGKAFSVRLELVGADPGHDVALLRLRKNPWAESAPGDLRSAIPRPCRPVPLDVDRPREGAAIAISGYSDGDSLVTTSGRIACSWLFDPRVPDGTSWYLADVQTASRKSGSPVFAIDSGVVIGLCKGYANSRIRDGDGNALEYHSNNGLSLVIPARHIAELMNQNGLTDSRGRS